MIVGTFIGIAFQLLKLRLPSGLEHAAVQLANATSPIMLFLLGGFFEFSDLRDDLKTVSAIVIGRLIIIPGVRLGLACLLGFRGVEFASLLGAFASHGDSLFHNGTADGRRCEACGQRRCRNERAVLTDAFPVGNDLQNCWCNIGDKNE